MRTREKVIQSFIFFFLQEFTMILFSRGFDLFPSHHFSSFFKELLEIPLQPNLL